MTASRDKLSLIGAGVLVGVGLGILLLALIGLRSSWLEGVNLSSGLHPDLVPETDSPALDFSLQGMDGKTVKLSDLRGHTILINFWATWCGPCREEMPLIQKYYQRYSPDLVVLAVNNDEPAADVQSFVKELGLGFTVLLDPGEQVENQYRIRAFPTSVFIDRQGTIRFIHVGSLNEDQLSGYIKKIGVGS